VRRLASTAALLAVLCLALSAGGTAAAAGASITITAAEMTTDAAGMVVATGRVRISDGTNVAEGARVVLDTRRRVAVFTPGVVRGPQGVLQGRRLTVRYVTTRLTEVKAEGDATIELQTTRIAAGEITLGLVDQRVTAAGRVRVQAPPDVQAEGARLQFQRRTGLLTLAGQVRVQTAQGVAEGTRLEARIGLQEIRMWGDVRVRFGDIAARADAATLLLPAKRAILTGAVRVEQRGRVLWAERVTVDYGAGRVVAEGPLRMRIPDPAGP